MLVHFSDLLELKVMKPLKLIGGKNGFDKIVSTAVFTIGLQVPKWFNGGEVLIVVSEEEVILDDAIVNMLEACNNCKCAGIIFLKTKLNEFQFKLLEDCANEKKIPIFIGDDIVNPKDIYESISKIINLMHTSDGVVHELVKSILFYAEGYDVLTWVYMLKCLEFDIYGWNAVGIVNVKLNDKKEDKKYVYKKIQRVLKDKYGDELVTYWKDLFIIILSDKKSGGNSPLEKLECIYDEIKKDYPNSDIKIAVGESYNKLVNIQNSIGEAFRTIDMISLIEEKQKVYSYKKLGVYRVLYELKNKFVFEKYCQEIFGDIEKYDVENNSNLMKTLEAFSMNNCCIEETAKSLFIHKNSLRYRLNRIEEITKSDFKNISTLVEFMAAMKIRKLLAIVD